AQRLGEKWAPSGVGDEIAEPPRPSSESFTDAFSRTLGIVDVAHDRPRSGRLTRRREPRQRWRLHHGSHAVELDADLFDFDLVPPDFVLEAVSRALIVRGEFRLDACEQSFELLPQPEVGEQDVLVEGGEVTIDHATDLLAQRLGGAVEGARKRRSGALTSVTDRLLAQEDGRERAGDRHEQSR